MSNNATTAMNPAIKLVSRGNQAIKFIKRMGMKQSEFGKYQIIQALIY